MRKYLCHPLYYVITVIFGIYRKNDRLTIYDKNGKADSYGHVEYITPSVTSLVEDGKYRSLVPNSKIYEGRFRDDGPAGTELRRFVSFYLQYFEDLDAAKKIILEEGNKFKDRMIAGKEPVFKLGQIESNKFEVRLYFWSTLEDSFLVDDLSEAIVRRFTEEKIQLGNLPKSKEGYA